MDICEKRVIRRKKPLIAESLRFSKNDQKKYIVQGLLTDSMIGDIMIETTEFGQMFRYIDHLMQQEHSFEIILKWLEDGGKSWIADEIRAEVSSEKEQLHIEQYVYREAGVLVHRQYGKSTVIPEVHKKEIQMMLALRYQTAKEAWQRQLIDSRLEEEKLRLWKSELTGRLKLIVEKIETFLRIQQKHINEMSHDSYTCHDQTRPDPDPENHREYLQVLDDKVDNILDVLARVVFERQNMTDERKRCLKVLHTDRRPHQLDIILNHALNNAAEDAVRAQRDADLSDKLAQTLDVRMRSLRIDTDKELAFKDRRNAQLSATCKDKERQIKQLETNLNDTLESLSEAKSEICKLNRRCTMIEKTRRIGYYNPGWYDKLYGSDEIEYMRCTSDTPPPLAISTRSKSAYNHADRKHDMRVEVPPLFIRRSHTGATCKIDNGATKHKTAARMTTTTTLYSPKTAR